MSATDDFIVLDPTVRIEDLPPGNPSIWSSGEPVRRGWLLVNEALESAAVVPPGRGLRQFVEDLREPTQLSELVEPTEIGTNALAWQLLDNLVRRGFAYRASDRELLADLERLRAEWRARCRHARRRLRISADSIGELDGSPAPSLTLVCHDDPRELAGLQALTDAYERGSLRLHDVVVELRAKRCSGELRALARRLDASVRISGIDTTVVRELVADQVPVTVRLDVDARLLATGLGAVTEAVTAERVTTLELALAWDTFAATDGAVEAAAASIVDRVAALADALGDVRICGFPTDDEIIQAQLAEPVPKISDVQRAARRLHLARRARHLVDLEGHAVWAQDPQFEELWVPLDGDLLPNRPDLLRLREGSVVADIAGGFGRVARRLVPHVGTTGRIISIEKEPLFSSRAQRFAAELGVHGIQSRVGLGQRIPLPDDSIDAAVLEWGGQIHREGLLGRCIAEMTRVVRPGKRVAITYRLCNLQLENLTEVFTTAPTIYPALRAAIEETGLAIVDEKFWAVQPRMSDAPILAFEERFVPRIVDDLRDRKIPRMAPTLDLTLTVIAEKLASSISTSGVSADNRRNGR